jgi:hypothetical protein
MLLRLFCNRAFPRVRSPAAMQFAAAFLHPFLGTVQLSVHSPAYLSGSRGRTVLPTEPRKAIFLLNRTCRCSVVILGLPCAVGEDGLASRV